MTANTNQPITLIFYMKRFLFLFVTLLIAQGAAAQALSPEELAKRAKRKNLTVKEWNTDSNKKQRWLDNLKTYEWNHVVATFDAEMGEMCLFLNGEKVASGEEMIAAIGKDSDYILDFTVERSGKTLVGSAASGEGLVNVYRGTGRVLLAPVDKAMPFNTIN